MRNRIRMFSRNFGFGRGMGRGCGFGFGGGRMDGTGPRAQKGICLRHPQDSLASYKKYLEEELNLVSKEIERN